MIYGVGILSVFFFALTVFFFIFYGIGEELLFLARNRQSLKPDKKLKSEDKDEEKLQVEYYATAILESEEETTLLCEEGDHND